MATGQDLASAGVADRSGSATETLSQFVARVLDQLSLSAWLPSAALVMLLAYVTQLGSVLDSRPAPADPVDAFGQAFSAMAQISVGGALLLAAAVVVLTMVTQAFSFEAIRVLEGYWGTNRAVEWFACHRCNRHRKIHRKLVDRLAKLTEKAWVEAATEIDRKQTELVNRGLSVVFTPNMISVLGAPVLGKKPVVTLEPEEVERIKRTDWRDFAPPDLLRRRVNVQHRLRDFPNPNWMLPTRLGNILRHYERKTGQDSIESLVQEVFDDLPLSLRVEHDEQRTRLDLYCSMVVVVALVTVFAVARLGTDRWHAVAALSVGLASMWLIYRAAAASAQAYGPLLLRMTTYARHPSTEA